MEIKGFIPKKEALTKTSTFRMLFFSLAICTVLVSIGCVRFPVRQTLFAKDTILILPPRDVVQGGVPHEKGEGSGVLLLDAVQTGLIAHGWETLVTDNKKFNHLEVANKEDAISEANKLKTRYVLQLALGEFLNAAPMSFRPDYVTLSKAVMFEAKTGEVVWAITKPVLYKKTNIGNHIGLINKFGAQVVKSIVTNR